MVSRYAPKQFKAIEWKENTENLVLFFKQLPHNEIITLLKDKEFKKTFCNNVHNVDYHDVLKGLTDEEVKIFIDNEFVKLMESQGVDSFKGLYAGLDKDVLGEIILQDFATSLIRFDAIIEFIYKDWNEEIKSKIYWTAVDELDINNSALARLTR